MSQLTGIVVPTLGQRSDYLEKALKSIRLAGNAYILVVAPRTASLDWYESAGLIDLVIDDPDLGLASAINLGIEALPPDIRYVNWLGDDDLLEPKSITKLEEVITTGSYSFVWGQCRYINSVGQEIWINKSGSWATQLLKFGPNLVPQPGALIERFSFDAVGGLDTKYGWAFDQDLFIRLNNFKKGKYVPQILGSFRWHSSSLSAGSREGSIKESSEIRKKNLTFPLRHLSFLWEPAIRRLSLFAGKRMNHTSQQLQRVRRSIL